MDELKPFTITRSIWLHGEGGQNSFLLRGDGKQCCLGQLAERLYGVTRNQMEYMGTLDEILCEMPDGLSWSVSAEAADNGSNAPSALAEALMAINDDEFIDDATREHRLVEKFAEIGYAVTFEN